MQSSFYGGLPGYSFFIAKCYNSVASMNQSFARSDCPVHYGEYALITAEIEDSNGNIQTSYAARNNVENGRIYYRDSDGHAVYKGLIIGPAGFSPDLLVDNYSTVENKYNTANADRRLRGESRNDELVPGFDGTNYNDTIKWYSVSVDSADGTRALAYIGFRFPYPTFEFEPKLVSWLDTLNITEVNAADGHKHKFHHKFEVSIPKGKPGTEIVEFGVINKTQLSSTQQNRIPTAYRNYQRVVAYKIKDYSTNVNGTISEYIYAGAIEEILDAIITSPAIGTLPTAYENKYGHLFVQWVDSSKNTILYNGKYWADLGPSGMAPDLIIKPFIEVEAVYNSVTNAERKGRGQTTDVELIPGRESDGVTYHDAIEWVYANKDTNTTAVKQAWLGFKVPYPVFEFNGQQVSAYDALTIQDDTPSGHKFYHKYLVKIPAGKHGTDLSELKIIDNDGTHIIEGSIPAGVQKVMVYKTINYNDSAAGTPSQYQYVGYVNEILEAKIEKDDLENRDKLLLRWNDNRGTKTDPLDSTKKWQIVEGDLGRYTSYPYYADISNVNLSSMSGADTQAKVVYYLNHTAPFNDGLAAVNHQGFCVVHGEGVGPRDIYIYDLKDSTWKWAGSMGSTIKNEIMGTKIHTISPINHSSGVSDGLYKSYTFNVPTAVLGSEGIDIVSKSFLINCNTDLSVGSSFIDQIEVSAASGITIKMRVLTAKDANFNSVDILFYGQEDIDCEVTINASSLTVIPTPDDHLYTHYSVTVPYTTVKAVNPNIDYTTSNYIVHISTNMGNNFPLVEDIQINNSSKNITIKFFMLSSKVSQLTQIGLYFIKT